MELTKSKEVFSTLRKTLEEKSRIEFEQEVDYFREKYLDRPNEKLSRKEQKLKSRIEQKLKRYYAKKDDYCTKKIQCENQDILDEIKELQEEYSDENTSKEVNSEMQKKHPVLKTTLVLLIAGLSALIPTRIPVKSYNFEKGSGYIEALKEMDIKPNQKNLKEIIESHKRFYNNRKTPWEREEVYKNLYGKFRWD